MSIRNILRALTVTSIALLPLAIANADTFTWNQPSGTNSWNSNANWLPATGFPNAVDDVANVNNDITVDSTINLNVPITLGTLNIGDANGNKAFNINSGGGGSFIFDVTTGNAAISKTTGRIDTISANIAIHDNLDVTNSVGFPLNLSGAISESGGSYGLNVGGGFTSLVTLSGANTYTGTTTINGGVLRVESAENVGVSGPLGTSAAVNPGSIVFGGGYLQYSAVNQFDYSGRFSTAANQLFRVDLNSQNVTWAANLTNLGTSGLTVTNAGLLNPTEGRLELTGINTFGSGGILVGVNPDPANNLSGSLLISTGSTSTTGTLNIASGANALGLVRVTGTGSLSAASTVVSNSTREAALRLSSGSISAGTLSANNGRGLIAVDGGTFSYTTLNLNSAGAAPSIFDVSGGSVSGGQANIGSANARSGEVTVRGGTFTATGMNLGNNNISGTLDVSETGKLNLGTANLRIAGGSGTGRAGTANLVGGTVSAGGIEKFGGTEDRLTFSGGTLQATKNSATFVQGLSSANIYVGGATIDTQNFDVTIAQVLQGNTGNGITSIAVDAGGSGYLAPPTIAIVGGGGTGATAVANLDQNGSVESITVTNPGVGYTGAVTYTINNGLGGGGGFVAGASTLGDNTTGGLTKVGSGTLTLAGANTYTGVTDIQAGTLALDAAGSISSSTGVSIAAAAEFDTTAQAFTMLASQPFTFDIDPTGLGSAGLLDATSLDITNGDVSFNPLGTLDDPFYVFANYTSLTGASFANASTPSGYAIDYNYLGGNQIALVQQATGTPEPSTLVLAVLGLVGLAATRRRRNRS